MTWATEDANESKKKGTNGESQFLGSTLCRPIQLSERAAQLKLARKVHGKRRRTLRADLRYWYPGPPLSKSVQPPARRSMKRKRRSSQFEILTLQKWCSIGTSKTLKRVCNASWTTPKRKIG